MEIYKGKPIFYSLGNFIEQHDLVYKSPADAYQRFGIDPALTPGMLSYQREDGGTKGFAADPRYWQTVVPTCHFDNGSITRVEIVPVSLGFGLPMHARGIPRLAEGDEATTILANFARLSEPFGTRFDIDGEIATVLLA